MSVEKLDHNNILIFMLLKSIKGVVIKGVVIKGVVLTIYALVVS